MHRNRFEIAPQALLLSVGVILSIVLISVMVTQFEQARSLSDEVSRNMLKTGEQIRNSDLMQYDGIKVSGAEVRNFFKMQISAGGPDGFDTLVINNGKTTGKYSESGKYSLITDMGSAAYVNPTDVYLCSILSNANGMITTVTFTKQ